MIKIMRSVNMPIFMRGKSKISEIVENTCISSAAIFSPDLSMPPAAGESLVNCEQGKVFVYVSLPHFSPPFFPTWRECMGGAGRGGEEGKGGGYKV